MFSLQVAKPEIELFTTNELRSFSLGDGIPPLSSSSPAVDKKDALLLLPLRFPPFWYQTTTGFRGILERLRQLQPAIVGGGWNQERTAFVILARDDAPTDWFDTLCARMSDIDPELVRHRNMLLVGHTSASHAAQLSATSDVLTMLEN
jgi:hypothetical protein